MISVGEQAKRTASPLTPAVSPLRGEGQRPSKKQSWAELDALRISERRSPSPLPSPRGRGRTIGRQRSFAKLWFFDGRATGLPLLGERAGVRGKGSHVLL